MQFAFWRFICDLFSFEVDEVESDMQLVKAGDIFDHSKIIRIDRGFGLLLEIPTAPFPTPAYVSVSDVVDEEVKKLEKTFRDGSHVRVRILGFKHLEGLAMGVLKVEWAAVIWGLRYSEAIEWIDC